VFYICIYSFICLFC